MREAKLIETKLVLPEEVVVGTRLRPLSESGKQSVIASFREVGIIKDEVILRKVKHKGGELHLIAGLHRLEACRDMGVPVPAKIYDCTDKWAKLVEVDDNLAGAELNALDTAVFLAERQRIYEDLHPEAVRGKAGAEARWNATDIMSFASATADKFNITERHVRRMTAAGRSLQPDEIDLLRTAEKPVALSDLTEIGKISEPSERSAVVAALASGSAKNASAARKAHLDDQGGAPTAEVDPAEASFKALLSAWSRAPMSAKRRFVEDAFEGLSDLVSDEVERRER